MGLLPNIATGVHFITYTYTSLVSCIYSWHCGRGVWLLGSTKHFTLKLSSSCYLSSLTPCFSTIMSQSGLGWAQLRLFLARFFFFFLWGFLLPVRLGMKSERTWEKRRTWLSVATARVVLKFNRILSRQWGWQTSLLSVSHFPPPYFYLFRRLTLVLHILSALFYSYHSSKQHTFELTQITTFLINQVCPSRFLCIIFRRFSYWTQCCCQRRNRFCKRVHFHELANPPTILWSDQHPLIARGWWAEL